VLEVKLQLATGTTMPEWVAELLTSGCLREMPKFSKFVHGTAFLKRNDVRELPYWCAPALSFSRALAC
jgi:SPX domain protein involved in polyphosphate accumulation